MKTFISYWKNAFNFKGTSTVKELIVVIIINNEEDGTKKIAKKAAKKAAMMNMYQTN